MLNFMIDYIKIDIGEDLIRMSKCCQKDFCSEEIRKYFVKGSISYLEVRCTKGLRSKEKSLLS